MNSVENNFVTSRYFMMNHAHKNIRPDKGSKWMEKNEINGNYWEGLPTYLPSKHYNKALT